MRYLTQANKNYLWKALKPGDLFTYSESFLLQDVQNLAKENGVTILYATPGTTAYRRFGCFCCGVL